MRTKFSEIALAMILVFAGVAMADEEAAPAKTTYNSRAGINFSSIWNARSVFGFHVGGMIDIQLASIDIADDAYPIEVHPGAQLIKKGGTLWRRDYYTGLFGLAYWGYNYVKVDAYYLEVPVPFSIKKRFSDNVSARVDFGPYFAFGLFGTKDAFDLLSRFDAGVIYGGTIDFAKRYSLGFHSGVGLSDDDISTLYITLGYRL